MKKIILFILGISLIFVVNSCKNNESDENNTQDTTKNVQDVENTDDVVENVSDDTPETEGIELRAKFDGIYLGSDGAIITFKGEDGNDYEFYDDGNQQVRDIFDDVDPTNIENQKHIGEWYNLKYKTKTIERYNGASGEYYDDEVLVILSIQSENANGNTNSTNNGISFETLKNAIFFGNMDRPWTLKFKEDKIEFTPNIGEEMIAVYYTNNPKVTTISNNEVQVKATPDLDKGYIWTITIKKESCSDGESDNNYPYSMHIQWEHSQDTGCGRNL